MKPQVWDWIEIEDHHAVLNAILSRLQSSDNMHKFRDLISRVSQRRSWGFLKMVLSSRELLAELREEMSIPLAASNRKDLMELAKSDGTYECDHMMLRAYGVHFSDASAELVALQWAKVGVTVTIWSPLSVAIASNHLHAIKYMPTAETEMGHVKRDVSLLVHRAFKIAILYQRTGLISDLYATRYLTWDYKLPEGPEDWTPLTFAVATGSLDLVIHLDQLVTYHRPETYLDTEISVAQRLGYVRMESVLLDERTHRLRFNRSRTHRLAFNRYRALDNKTFRSY